MFAQILNQALAPSASSSVSLVKDLPLGDIQFYDNYIPFLKDGDYTITATPVLQDANGQAIASQNELSPVSQTFSVNGPRFTLNAADIHAIYPAADSTGQFHTSLPSLLFNKRSLPWERNFIPEKPIPWIALLVFDESEASKITFTPSISVNTWLNSTNTLIPKITFTDEENDLICQTITLDPTLFTSVIPTLEELPYFTHCRQINTGDREILNLKDDGWFSGVFTNRFPKEPSDTQAIKHTVYLVSLEGCIEYLQSETPLSKPIQLAALTHWSFNCLPDPKENFEQLMTAIVDDQKSHPLLNLPSPVSDNSPSAKQVSQRFLQGYVPLEYTTRTAESSFAWYRGPFTPINLAPLPLLQTTSSTGDSTRIYDSEEGVFDLSYKTAWDLGRGLALSDADFTQTLMALRLSHQQEKKTLLRRARLEATLYQEAPSLSNPETTQKPLIYAFAKSIEKVVPALNQILASPTKSLNASTPACPQYESPYLRFTRRQNEERALLQKNPGLAADWNIPDSIITWVRDKLLLKGLPFQYLIADPKLLPMESLRFFYIDPNWTQALINGAFSLGLHTRQMVQDNEALKQAVMDALLKPENSQNTIPVCGFLLRSTVVSGWPGLAIRLPDQKDQTVNIVRQERLSNEVLLCLFNKNPNTVIVAQPQEQLNFGVDLENDKKDEKPKPLIALRNITGKIGSPLGTSLDLKNYLRPAPATRVMNMAGSNASSSNSLLTAFKSYLNKDLSPAEVAIQFIQVPLAAQFKPT